MESSGVALYLRLSREDGDEVESQSITNQRSFLMQYAAHHNLVVTDVFSDDGYSGIQFDRPDFQRMLAKIERRTIGTVLVKDLSRLGRDYIETGRYLERYFPEHQVRFIAVNDNIDTDTMTSGNDMAPMLSVFNDMYAKDISKKVRTSLRTKKQAGYFIGSNPPYGYQKSETERGKLVIDPETAPVIKRIFSMYLQTDSIMGVAKCITEQRIPTPSQYRYQNNLQRHRAVMWSDAMIRRILENPTYAGHLTQNRAKKLSYKIEKRISLPQSEWITVQNTHEAIITQEQFDQTRQLLQRRTYVQRETGRGAHLLSGLVFCADCGSPMTFVRESPTRIYMVCRTSHVSGRLHLCTSHCIRESYVEQVIRDTLRTLSAQLVNRQALEQSVRYPAAQQYQALVSKLRQKYELAGKAVASLYMDKVKGIITEAQFVKMNEGFLAEQKRLQREIDDVAERQIGQQQEEKNHMRLKRLLSFETLDRGTLLALVKKVVIHADKKMDIIFCFSKPN